MPDTTAETPIVAAQTAAAVALERRLTLIEDAIRSGFEVQATRAKGIELAVGSLEERVKVQNSRIGKLEDWKHAIELAQTFAKGVIDGKASVGKAQLALLAVIGPLLFAAVDSAIRIWH